MFLYNLTLQQPTAIHQLAIGNFSGTRQQEVALAHHSVIELIRVEATTGKCQTILSHDCFGVIRAISSFRLTGASKDYLVVASDSGRIVILEYNPIKNVFDKVHQETYGKSGCRRIVPGQYLAADPKGRAVVIGAVEKQKLVYILNRSAASQLTISSPLEAHKSHTICHGIVGVDVGYENPIFASIEVDYADLDQDPTGEALQNIEKVLTYYELDLGLNHVVRKWSEPVDLRTNFLVAVPGGSDGPSGVVLCCSEGYITWRHQDHAPKRVPIPRRLDPLQPIPSAEALESGNLRGVIVVASVVHRLKRGFFILVQTEDGDIFKITMDYQLATDGGAGSGVENLKIKYFDTIPVAGSMVLFKTGLLFVASEFGNHYLYRIDSLGDDDDEQPEYTSADLPQSLDEVVVVPFQPRGLRNLTVMDELDSLSPLIDCRVANLADEDTPQLFVLCGRGARSSFRTLRHGLEATEVGVTELPGDPTAVWTVRLNSADEFDSYIVVSFANATLVFSIGETVEERTDTGFLDSTPTLTVGQIGDDALVQVYPQGIRHIRADRRVSEWKSASSKYIVKAACNQRQVVIALSSLELVYFELDASGQLNEFQGRKEMNAPVTSITLGPVPKGRQRSKYLAVGCSDNTVRMISLDPENCLESLSIQALSSVPESLAIVEMLDTGATVGTTYLNIGMQNGVLLRTMLDTVTGTLSDTRMRFLGSRPVKLIPIKIQGSSALLALSTRPWLSFTFQSRNKLIPLSYELLEYGSSFCSDLCPEGIVAIAGSTLRILVVERLANVFNQSVVNLKYTPRRFVLHPPSNNFIVVESDHNTFSPSVKARLLGARATEGMADEIPQELPPEQFGLPRAEAGNWGSCVRVVNPLSAETLSLVDLDDNEAAFCVTLCSFASSPSRETCVIVGGGQGVTLAPRRCVRGFLRTYSISDDGSTLTLQHKTALEDIPTALCNFQGRLLVGMGNVLRIYDRGRQRLLRKMEAKGFPNIIMSIHTQGNRIIVTDVMDSVHYAIYVPQENRITIFADDVLNRYVTSSVQVDYDTVAGGDKFGNLFVVRLPDDVSKEVDEDPAGNKMVYEKGYLNGAAFKIQHLCEFHVGETITSLQKTSLVAGGREVLLYTTILGRVGVLVPFVSKEDVDFFQTLEMHLRGSSPPLLGRDHIAFRSVYQPVRNVVDGDLCEMFHVVAPEKRRAIAEDMDRSVAEVSKKLEDLRNRVAF
ncbi:CPSF A subunit region-domain-containing protein [Zopfochytrium polystomum]|nr:CPSF A subunit region-domain-containing protein [Zopfochytrium polystomum]